MSRNTTIMSLDMALVRNVLKTGVVRSFGTDGPVAIRLRNKAVSPVTSVTVTTATNLVLIDAVGTTTSTFATDTTIGAVVARINASANWEARVLDALNSLASASTLVTGAITASVTDGVTYYDLKVDTSAAKQIGVSLTVDRHTPQSGKSKTPAAARQHRLQLTEIQYLVDMGTAAVDSAQLWFRSNPSFGYGGGVETKQLGLLSVDATLTTINWAGGCTWITAPEGQEMIFLVKDAATLADSTGNFVRISGFIE